MPTIQHSEQGRNSEMDKTDPAREAGDAYANQGGGKLGSGTENSGHPANDVIAAEQRRDANPGASGGTDDTTDGAKKQPGDPLGIAQRRNFQPGADVKGSGTPTLSGAGRLADDRPGRDAPKAGH